MPKCDQSLMEPFDIFGCSAVFDHGQQKYDSKHKVADDTLNIR
jgi:hypothetical protein